MWATTDNNVSRAGALNPVHSIMASWTCSFWSAGQLPPAPLRPAGRVGAQAPQAPQGETLKLLLYLTREKL